MKKVLSVVLIILCVGAFALGDAFAKKPDTGEKINGVSRLTHSGDIEGTFTLSGTCIANDLQVLVYIPGVSIVARAVTNVSGGPYNFVLYNVPEGLVDVKVDVLDVTGTALTTFDLQSVTVQKQRVFTIDPVPLTCPQ